MQKQAGIFAVVMILIMALASVAFAGVKNSTGPLKQTFTFPDAEVTACQPSGCIEVFYDNAYYTIYGIGPDRIYSDAGVERPAVGDIITISGYISLDGLYVATEVIIGDVTVYLRDERGRPKWRR